LIGGCGDIALWGDSYSEMICLVAGALIADVKAIVYQLPVFGTELPEIEPNAERFAEIQRIFTDGEVSGGL